MLGPIGPAAGPSGSTLSQYLPTDYRRPPPATNPNLGGGRNASDAFLNHWDWQGVTDRARGQTRMEIRGQGQNRFIEMEVDDMDEGMV